MRGLTSRLRNKLAVYGKTAVEDELGQSSFENGFIKFVYGEITNKSGSNASITGDVTQYSTTHKIVIRKNAIKNLSSEMFFVHDGIRYDIEYFNPDFKYNDSIEIFVKRIEGLYE